MGKGKFLKGVAALAAIGGVCYVFRDKIKSSTVYQSLDMDEKVEKVKNTIKDKMPVKEESERDYFSLDDDTENGGCCSSSSDDASCKDEADDAVSDDASSEETDEGTSEEAAAISDSVADVTAKVDSLISDIPVNKNDETDTDESPLLYENEGLSDVSEDLDVIEEQDKLDL